MQDVSLSESTEDFKFDEVASKAIKDLEKVLDAYANSSPLNPSYSALEARDTVSAALLEIKSSFPKEYKLGLEAAVHRKNPTAGILYLPDWEIAVVVSVYEAILLIRASTFKEIGEQILASENAIAWLKSYCEDL